ncbi:siroheme decarboxylase subunit beta [Pseudothauera rhizosphaerae]|uniref:siroheme decarboxylase n=1 Tax=Pseudothauera rhizosphaerae TaxID=2565932 RepID=A0A4S4AEL2_9RHOO|nr:Lrp/AsnC family transcriptional regulator [Pseudothauera rhizosphaerae]THF57226.1 Lrp/AsnC family transcriptional regulator [Pseudothauera rhizosphaerae]
MDEARLRLLNDWQHGFPLVERPFAEIGAAVGMSEDAVLAAYRAWQADGVVSRIGPVVAARRLGASALAALAVPAGDLDAVAARVSALPEVNHNYEREHRYNLWFVVAAPDAARLDAVFAGIEADTGLAAIVLPMEEAYHIDLGFDLGGGAPSPPAPLPRGERENTIARTDVPGTKLPSPLAGEGRGEGAACALPGIEHALLHALQQGLPLVPRPFDALGERVELSGALVCALIDEWLAAGLLRRFGVVVRHHELGYTANAMCVWDVADGRVAELGRQLGAEPGVTLCYRRRHAPPHWPYNLFCMIHGRARDEVLARRDAIAARLGLDAWPHAVLFSRRRFKQCGACYLPDPEAADA